MKATTSGDGKQSAEGMAVPSAQTINNQDAAKIPNSMPTAGDDGKSSVGALSLWARAQEAAADGCEMPARWLRHTAKCRGWDGLCFAFCNGRDPFDVAQAIIFAGREAAHEGQRAERGTLVSEADQRLSETLSAMHFAFSVAESHDPEELMEWNPDQVAVVAAAVCTLLDRSVDGPVRPFTPVGLLVVAVVDVLAEWMTPKQLDVFGFKLLERLAELEAFPWLRVSAGARRAA